MSQEMFAFLQKSSPTPMMQQYLGIKQQYQDCILFYRMGDFYEMFFEDAIKASKLLNIALTKRGKHDTQNIPMCGVPFHSSEGYLHKLIISGEKVAICEQMESPEDAKKRGHKSVVKREVIRVVTPGTIFEENLLDHRSSNFLLAITKIHQQFAMAYVDLSTAEFFTLQSSIASLSSDIARLAPKEILVNEKLLTDSEFYKILSDWKKVITPHAANIFDYRRCLDKIYKFYEVSSLDSFGELNKAQISACGAIIEYITLTQKEQIPILPRPKIERNTDFMIVDSATRRNLEIESRLSGQKDGTLLSVLDQTVTSMGARKLSNYLASPLIDAHVINYRLDLVEFFYNQSDLTKNIRCALANINDFERAAARVIVKKGGPRDLILIKNSLSNMLKLSSVVEFSGIELPNSVVALTANFGGFDELIDEINRAIVEEAPILPRDGAFIKQGYNLKLDELRDFAMNSKNKLSELTQHYIAKTGVTNLKLKKNNLLGFFIEVSPQQSEKLTSSKEFIHRQSLANAVRFTSIELKEIEDKLTNASDLMLKIELDIFEYFQQLITEFSGRITIAAQGVAMFDLVSSFAFLAQQNNYTRPIIDNSKKFEVIGGRHPSIEVLIKELNNKEFIANNCRLEDDQLLWLLTGPNMAGKSTFLRQNAIIVIMAQIGCFVPAEKAHIGVVDRIFSRVGAADDLARGRSTFMVEMVETATILNLATDKSLVILDEIGRGTSTYDGVSIAWASLEHIHNDIACRTIFATHYHELTKLEPRLINMKCFNVVVKEWQDKIIFMHHVTNGMVDKSYGIHVAKIAGMPNSVTQRAQQILYTLESKKNIDIFEHVISEEHSEQSIS